MIDVLIDVGGTGLKITYSYDGKINPEPYLFNSKATENADNIIKNFCEIVLYVWEEAVKKCGKDVLSNIYMAFPGPFDYKNGVSKMKGLNKYDSIFGVNIPQAMNNCFSNMGLDIKPNYKFIHDIEAYAIGVCKQHKLNEKKVIYLCIGTGAGSAYTDNGVILKSGCGVPENGWFYYYPFKSGTIDDYISVRGIENLSIEYMDKKYSPLDISIQAKKGFKAAIQVYKVFGENLAEAMHKPIYDFNPECFVIGGNISKSSELFIAPLLNSIKKINCELIVEDNTSEMIFHGLSTLS